MKPKRKQQAVNNKGSSVREPETDEIIDLTINQMRMGFDSRTGSLVHLSSLWTGEMLRTERKSAGLVDLAYPIKEFGPLRLASRFSRAKVTKENGGVTIVWDRLEPSRSHVSLPEGKVRAEVMVKGADDGRSVIMSCRIENASSSAVEQVLFPDLQGLRPFHGEEDTRLRFGSGGVPGISPTRGGFKPFAGPPLPKEGFGVIFQTWSAYPPASLNGNGVNAIRWLDLGSLEGGLSVSQRDWGRQPKPGVLTRRDESDITALRMAWEHQQSIKPGESWESGEFCLTPHPGGWAKGIEVYRDYVRQMNHPRKLPKRIRDGLGFQTIWMIQPNETDPAKATFRHEDLPRIAKDAKAHGLEEVVLWGWCYYFEIPVRLRPELGSWEELLAGIKKARDIGVNVVLFLCIQALLGSHAERYGVESRGSWTYHPEFIPQFMPYYSSIRNATWMPNANNEQFYQDCRKVLRELFDAGINSFILDIFDNRRFGRATGTVEDGFIPGGSNCAEPYPLRLAKEFGPIARERDPEATFGGEVIATGYEDDSEVLDYTWNWGGFREIAPIMNVFHTPRFACVIMESPLIVKAAFCAGFYLNMMPRQPNEADGTALVSEKPILSAAVKEVGTLHRQFLPYFVDGNNIGECVLSKPVDNLFVHAHQLENSILVFALNHQNQPQKAILKSNLECWMPGKDKYEVKCYESNGKLVESTPEQGREWTKTTPMLQPLELVCYEIIAT